MLTLNDKQTLLRFAHESLKAYLAEEPARLDNASELEKIANNYTGVFVSVYVGNKLRGCIGNLNLTAPLPEMIAEMAQAAANDPRFEPLHAHELAHVAIEISLLHQMQSMRSPDEIQIGRDGLLVRRGKKHGLLLPQVAAQRGWDVITFLEQTCHKASLPFASWQEPETEVFRFAAEVFSDHDEDETEHSLRDPSLNKSNRE